MCPAFTVLPIPSIPIPLFTIIVPLFLNVAPVTTSIPTPWFTVIVPLLIIVDPIPADIPTVVAPHAASVPPRLMLAPTAFTATAPSLTIIPTPPLSIFIVPVFVKFVPVPLA